MNEVIGTDPKNLAGRIQCGEMLRYCSRKLRLYSPSQHDAALDILAPYPLLEGGDFFIHCQNLLDFLHIL